MSTLDEVKEMQNKGMPETDIVKTLREGGVPYKDISYALEQSKIKAAVEEPPSEPITSPIPTAPAQAQPTTLSPAPPTTETTTTQEMPGMEKSMLGPRETEEATQPYPTPTEEYATQQPYSPEEPAYGGGYGYPQYEYQTPGISSDTITEISEQVVSERLNEIRKHIEKVIDFKTTTESKIESVEERLKRIEKIIDTLQSSVLKKVGDYVTNIEDIKKELIETQKTFTKLVPGMRTHAHKTKTTAHKTHKKRTSHRKKK